MTPARRTVAVLSVLGMIATLPLVARSQVEASRFSISIDGVQVAVVEQAGEARGEVDVGGHRFLRDFFTGRADSLITEVGIPALDAELRRPVKMFVKFDPAYARHYKHAAFPAREAAEPGVSFRLVAPGLDGSAVTAVDAFSVRRVARTQPVKVLDGESTKVKHRDTIEIERPAPPGDFAISDVVLRIEESDAAAWTEWQTSFQAGRAEKKNLRLEILERNRVLIGLELRGAEPITTRRRQGRRETYLVLKLEQVLVSG